MFSVSTHKYTFIIKLTNNRKAYIKVQCSNINSTETLHKLQEPSAEPTIYTQPAQYQYLQKVQMCWKKLTPKLNLPL